MYSIHVACGFFYRSQIYEVYHYFRKLRTPFSFHHSISLDHPIFHAVVVVELKPKKGLAVKLVFPVAVLALAEQHTELECLLVAGVATAKTVADEGILADHCHKCKLADDNRDKPLSVVGTK